MWGRVCGSLDSGPTLQENTFQTVLVTDGYISVVLAFYCDIQWGEGATGFYAGDGVRSFLTDESSTPQATDIDEGSVVGIPGLYIIRVDGDDILLPDGKLLIISMCVACLGHVCI